MSEQKVFMIANLKINDKDTYQIYEKGFFPILKKYDGEFVTYDDSVETFEGSSPLDGRTIIFSFPSPEKAREWLARNIPTNEELEFFHFHRQKRREIGLMILNIKSLQKIEGLLQNLKIYQ